MKKNITKHIATTTLLYLALLTSPSFGFSQESLFIITNSNNSVLSLTKEEIRNIFLGKIHSFPNGRSATPINLRKHTDARKAFMAAVINTSESKWRSHWARLLFTGRGKPPKEFEKTQDMINLVATKESAISYFVGNLDDTNGITVLMEIPTK